MFPTADGVVDLAGWYHLVVFGVLVPVLAWRSRRKIAAGAPLPPRIAHFKSTAAMLALFTLLSILVASVERIDLFPKDSAPSLLAIAAGVVMYAIAVAVMRPRWRRAVIEGRRVVSLFMPETAAERRWWVTVSLLAGFGEEVTWRGVQTALLYAVIVSYPDAALASALSFGLAHLLQGWKTADAIVVFALAFQGLVWLSGSLYVAIAVHAAYDLTAGWQYARFGKELGYRAA
jgi:membrane protease YdiL (CAAX protease family)